MILQALYEYYERKCADPENSDMAPSGWQWKEIPFLLVLDETGKLVAIDDRRSEKKNRAQAFLVPQEKVRPGSQIAPNLLWDKPDYLWGYNPEGKPDRLIRQREAFLEMLRALPQEDAGVRAACLYFSDPESALIQAQAFTQNWKIIVETGAFVALKLDGDEGLVCERTFVRQILRSRQMTEANTGICLVTGQESIIARTHAKIKNINNPEPNLVSFNEAAYCSYGKEQGENAPIGENAADAYTKALNHLLGKDSMQKIRLENTITVFWAQKKNVRAEAMLSSIFARKGNPKDNPDENSVVIKNLLKSPHKGGAPLPVDDRFYLLGLSPNAARLSVRFWLPTTATAIEEKLRAYFKQIHLEGGKLPYPPLRSLLSSLALEYKLENLSPILEGQVLQSIFSGADFPRTLLAVALARMRAEQNLPHLRAALIKAYLIRNGKKEITVSLDENCKDTPYLLGRLFSTLEKTQKDADTGDTIKNYFGAASMRPATVFPTLLKLHKHHLAKLGKEKIGLAVTREKLVIGIFGLLAATSFPATFSMEEQGMFAIGYYHQRQTFYTKSEKPESPESQAA